MLNCYNFCKIIYDAVGGIWRIADLLIQHVPTEAKKSKDRKPKQNQNHDNSSSKYADHYNKYSIFCLSNAF